MNKIITKLDFFTYDTSDYSEGARYVRWWVLEKDEDGNENGRTFKPEEEKLFIAYALSNPKNFPDNFKNVYLAENEDAPSIDLYDMVPMVGLHPSTIVLRKNPSKYTGARYTTMDIMLFPDHSYNLPFDVIGELNEYN